MSRSGYSEVLDNWDLIKWRGQVASAIRGKRGQKLLADLLKAMNSLPDKRLIHEELINEEGEMCALGVVGKYRGLNIEELDPEEPDTIALVFDIAPQLAREIVYENDESMGRNETPEKRFERMKKWALSNLKS